MSNEREGFRVETTTFWLKEKKYVVDCGKIPQNCEYFSIVPTIPNITAENVPTMLLTRCSLSDRESGIIHCGQVKKRTNL